MKYSKNMSYVNHKINKILFVSLFLLIPVTGNLPGDSTNKDLKIQNGILDGISYRQLSFKFPAIKESPLKNSGKLFLLNDETLPVIVVKIIFENGLNAEPAGKAGNLYSVARLLKLGGAGQLSGEEISRKLSLLGAELNIQVDYENWSVQLSALKEDFIPAFELLSEVLLNPELPENRLGIVKSELLSSIRQRNDRPESVARRKLMELLYPGDNRGYNITIQDIDRLNISSVKNEYKTRISNSKIDAALTGDFANMEIEKRIHALVNKIESGTKEIKKITIEDKSINKAASTGIPKNSIIYLVPFPAQQAVIAVGSNLPQHNHSDFFALQTMNYILGGSSFNSRLLNEIRTKRGLAYYTYSHNTFYKDRGHFVGMCGTGTDSTPKALSLILNTIDGMAHGVTNRELLLAHEAIPNTLIYEFENSENYMENYLRFRNHNMPDNYLEIFPKKIRSVGIEEINKVSSYTKSNNLFIVVVGPKTLEKTLSKIRPVKIIEPEEIPN